MCQQQMEGNDNGLIRKPEIRNYDVIVGGGSYLLITPITLANLSPRKEQNKSTGAGHTSFFPFR